MKVFLDTADVDAIRRANLTGHRLFVDGRQGCHPHTDRLARRIIRDLCHHLLRGGRSYPEFYTI